MSDTPTLIGVVDEEAYAAVAKRFAAALTEKLVGVLVQRRRLRNYAELSAEDADFIFDLAFTALARFEDIGGIDVPPRRYLAVVGFAEIDPDTPSQSPLHRMIVSHRRVGLHGSVSEEMLQQAFAKATSGTSA